MGSPKHLWSGDWQNESAAAAARRRGPEPPAASGHAEDPLIPHEVAGGAPGRPFRRPIAWDSRRLARGAVLLLALVLIAGAVVALLGRGDSMPSNNSSVPPQVPPTAQTSPGTGQAGPGTGQSGPGTGSGNGSGSPSATGAAWLGVELEPTSAGPVAINGIVAGGPADAAALRPGDVILDINNQSVGSLDDFNNVMSSLSPGQTVQVRVVRGSDTLTRQVTLAARHGGSSSP